MFDLWPVWKALNLRSTFVGLGQYDGLLNTASELIHNAPSGTANLELTANYKNVFERRT